MSAAEPARTALVFLDDDHPGGRLADAAEPQLSVLDLGVTRGDGIFESLLARDGNPRKLQAHLDRLQSSAQILELAVPAPERWRAAIDTALAAFGEPEAVVKLLATRGLEAAPGAERPTCWVQVSPAPHGGQRQHTEGIDVLLLERGYDSGIAERAPWLLLGAKTLSYSVNMAALRYARQHGAGDVIFYSADGRVLEGPTSSVLIARRHQGHQDADQPVKQLVTPLLDSGILPGTTQRALFDAAQQQGWQLGYGPLVPQDLLEASGVWLASSIRGLVPVRRIDGQDIPVDKALTEELNQLFDEIP
ncbi:aminodeoxychorismate lyase [Acaricomes phytoseiuli]|uniref:aminodeoxychorismate lyase n=1 Tax=Acaricomes phytoseiuli TaxID=291968 RepID=UPI00035E98F5|nr:aminodeoxychorismate lyase [Acaricomes phytoseiuli]MCW1248898.1 aminodeoxychorismate lyase [Acaricomes phytoseiuli]